ncbi:MAG: endolytic transglycosylase MltG, partial [Actinomycetota bacterium]
MTFLDEPDRRSPDDIAVGTVGLDELDWQDESKFVRSRPAGLRILRAAIAAVILAVIGVVIYTGARSWFGAQLDPEGEPGADVTVFIENGSTTGDIASTLESAGVIPNSTFFRYYAEWQDEGNFQAGEYTMQENMSADEAIARLQLGPKQIEYGEFL